MECARAAGAAQPESERVRTHADLARAVGSSQQALNHWKTRGVPKEVALRAEAVFGCRPAYVLEGQLPQFSEGAAINRPGQSTALASTKELSAGEHAAEIARMVLLRPAEVRAQVAQLATVMITNGPSKPLAAAIDELAHQAPAALPSAADIERNRAEKRADWERFFASMAAADLPFEQREEVDRALNLLKHKFLDKSSLPAELSQTAAASVPISRATKRL